MKKWNAPKAEEMNVQKTEFFGDLIEEIVGCNKPDENKCPCHS